MKIATIPPVRVLSEFMQTAVCDGVQRRRKQQEVVRRGLVSLKNAKLTNAYVDVNARDMKSTDHS